MTITPENPESLNPGEPLVGAGTMPAGWYPDPAGYPRSRWWDGAHWTMHYNRPFDSPVLAESGLGGSTRAVPAATVATAPVSIDSVNSVWIWLVILLPYLAFPFLFALEPLFAASALESAGAPLSPEEQLAILLSPSLIAFFIIGFTAPWVTIYCAYRDWRGLQSAQLAQPFHWAWSFLTLSGYPVYSIGRAIVTNRRAKQGMWVLWATIGVFVLVTVATIVWTLSFSVNSLQ